MGLEEGDIEEIPGLFRPAADPLNIALIKGAKDDSGYNAYTREISVLTDLRKEAAAIAARYASGSPDSYIKDGYLYYPEVKIVESIKEGGPSTTEITGKELKKRLSAHELSVFANLDQAEKNALSLTADAKKYMGGLSATGRSYMDTENDKTAEVKRQFVDFLDRAKGLYSLQDSEQAYAMRADDQNVATQKAIRRGDVDMGATSVYGTSRPGDRLSEILRPSLPRYVLPDYRLNQPAGMDGGGFDDEDYMPGFAMGTTGLPDAASMGQLPGARPRIDPEIAWMIGEPDIPIPHPKPVPVPASWMRER